MRINKKILSLGAIAGMALVMTGCSTQTNVIRTNDFTISGETAYNDALKATPMMLLKAQLKASDVKLLDKLYGSNNIDESKLLSQAKVKSGSAYLQQIGNDSGLLVINDEDAKKALRYIEQQKMAVKDVAADIFNDEDAKKVLEKNATYSVKHVLVNSEDDAKKMKEYLINGEENFDTLKEQSTQSKQSGAKDFASPKGISILEAADYPNVPKGQMVAEFETAGLTTSPMNAWSDPVKTSFGYHLQFIYARTGASAENQDLTAAKKTAAETMLTANKSTTKAIEMAMVKLREKNNFEITDETLKKEYETYKTELTKAFDEEKTTTLSGTASQGQTQVQTA